MKFGLRWIFVLVTLAAIASAFYQPKNTVGEHEIPIHPEFQFVSSEPYSREFNWEGDTGLFHGTRWKYISDEKLDTIKKFYEDAFPKESFRVDSNVYGPDYLSIIVNFRPIASGNAGESFSLSMIGREVTIEESKTFAPNMKWPD